MCDVNKMYDYSDIDFSTEFTRMVDSDIASCDVFLSQPHNYQEKRQLFIELVAKYSAQITGFGDGLVGYDPNNGRYKFNCQGEWELEDNIQAVKFKLLSYKNNDYRNSLLMDNKANISIENNLTANQNQTMTITFEDIKKQIENMSGLSGAETKETIGKIDEIKAIVELKESKKSKWQKIKPILIWLADKSVDVGCALLPLILKIGE